MGVNIIASNKWAYNGPNILPWTSESQSMGPDSEGAAVAMPRRRRVSVNTYKEEWASGGGDGKTAAVPDVAASEPLSPASRLFRQPRFDCCIMAMMGFERTLDVHVIKAGVEASLARHPRFSSVQVFDGSGSKNPRWVRSKVAIDDHVVVPDLSSGGGAASDQLVEEYVSSLSATKLDPSRPLWDLHLLNVPAAGAAAVAVLRIHHSLGDGTSLISLLLACTRKTSDPDSLPSLPSARSSPAPRRRGLLLLTWHALVLLWNTLMDALLFVLTAAFLRDTATPFSGAEGVEFRPKRFVHLTLSLDDVKGVKNSMGCTINDVLLGITSAGLSRYLSRKYREGSEGGKTNFPKSIRLRTTLLVNIRQSPGIHDLSEMMKGDSSSAKWGNQMGYIILPFSITPCKDPLDYVRNGKAIGERKKKSLEAIFTYTCAYWIVKIFGIKAAAALCHRVLCHTTLSFSNIMGPVEEIGFYGHPIVYLAPSVYGHPHALTIHYQSYMNKLTVVLAVDELAIPHPHQLLKDLAESLQCIKEAVAKRSKEIENQ